MGRGRRGRPPPSRRKEYLRSPSNVERRGYMTGLSAVGSAGVRRSGGRGEADGAGQVGPGFLPAEGESMLKAGALGLGPLESGEEL